MSSMKLGALETLVNCGWWVDGWVSEWMEGWVEWMNGESGKVDGWWGVGKVNGWLVCE